jgi:lysyl-tRNA synthetase class 2
MIFIPMNPEILCARSRIIRLIRQWFDEREFTEMHTPRLVGIPGQEPYLEPFWTEVSSPSLPPTAYRLPAALITSPEYMMKRILATGLDRIYDLGPCFRNNEPWDGTHDPEFLLLEWYRRDAGLEDLMRDTEEMMKWVIDTFVIPTEESATSGGIPLIRRSDPSALVGMTEKPFQRLTVSDAWKMYTKTDLEPLLDNREALALFVKERGQTVTEQDTWDDLFFKIFLTEVEPHLGKDRPTFLYRYPASMAALARKSADDPRFADRVELYAGGLELANGFAELSDPIEQRARFEEEKALRASLGKPTWGIDERFLAALPGMGNAAGIAFGVDRFVMLLTGATSINDVLPASARERFSFRE